jgi:hypothetical protein
MTTNARRLKRGLDPWMTRWPLQALGILTYTMRCAGALRCYRRTSLCVQIRKLPLMVNLHLVGNHRTLIIAQRFDIGDRKIPVMQFGQRFL